MATPEVWAEHNEQVNWRVWNTEDGMIEAYITQVTKTPSGEVLVRNGDVARLNVTDGFRLWTMPETRSLGRIEADSSGDLYTFHKSGVLIYSHGNWQKRPLPQLSEFASFGLSPYYGWFDYPSALDSDARVGAVLAGTGKMLFSFPDRLLLWSRDGVVKIVRRADQSGIGSFVDVSATRKGDYFVSGSRGLAILSRDVSQWKEIPPPPVGGRVEFPFLTKDGGILITYGAIGKGKDVLLFDGAQWKKIYSGSAKLRAWQTDDGTTWIAEGEQLLSTRGGRVRPVNLRPWITGRIMEALPDGNEFWLGTMQGLARYSPALWGAPGDAPELDSTVNAIAQDREGRLWFANNRNLISASGGEWRSYQLPRGASQDVGKTGSICPLDNGHILVLAADARYLLDLDPVSGSFRTLPHPEGRLIKWVERRDGSSIWLQSLAEGEPTSRLEIFDGAGFRVLPGAEAVPTTDVRSLLVTRDGAIWTGGTAAIVRIFNGRMQTFGKENGPVELSAFSLAETADGTLFIGHRDAISSFDGKTFHTLRRAMDRVRRLAISRDGTLWAASGTGVHRFKDGEWITNTTEDGLPGNAAYTVFEDREGRMWAGTTLGLSLFHPENDRETPLTIIHEDQNLRESPPGGEVRFAFSGLDRWKKTAFHRLLFSWRLDNGKWTSFAKATMASVKSLPSGAHVFQVRAMDRNGNIDPNPATFAFQVLLPWYREGGFYCIAGVLALALALLLRLGYTYHRNLRFQSRHDALTGLPNRLHFEEALAAAVERPRSGKRMVAVLFIDLDGFKSVNDALGHAAGDRVLADVGAGLKRSLAQGDLLARLGGDEFALLLTSIGDREGVARFADSILETIRKCSPEPTLPISASIGISLFPEHADSACVLVRLADLAMYQSKSRSGDCRLFYDCSMRVDFRAAEVAGLVRSALRDGHFVLWYQPVVDRELRVVHMECLVRIGDPTVGIVSPGVFIGIAEETGLIHDVGSWVLREGLRTAREWMDKGVPTPIAVNISPVQLERPELAGEILALISHYRLHPGILTVEITEGAIIKNRGRAVQILSELRAAGVRISLDDFGTGYSSLSMLDGMPLDEIKLDRSFAESIAGERTQSVICQTVSLARKLNATIVAEGIEQPAQMASALELGCDLFQGYLIAKPLEKRLATEFIALQSHCVEDRELIPS